MSNETSEYKITDTRGQFAQVVQNGNRLRDADWTNARIVLSNRRLVLATNAGKRTIPLSAITQLGGRHDATQAVAQMSNYVSVRYGADVVLVSPADDEAFETDLYRALLDQQVIFAKHPAVAGGVVQDSPWEKARIKVDENALNVALESGTFVALRFDDIGTVGTSQRTVFDEKRTVLEAEHTVEGTSVQTHLSTDDRRCSVLMSILRKGEEHNKTSADLSVSDKEVLMALYTGVSPFEIPNFLGVDVDEVEAIFERLIELEIVEEVRTRREVTLKSRGRTLASEAMNEQ
jgi:helix-turn-helix protein